MNDASLLVIFIDHAKHNGVNLRLFFQVLFVGLCSLKVSVINLLLNFSFVLNELTQLVGIALTLDLVSDLLVLEHSDIDLSIVLLKVVKQD